MSYNRKLSIKWNHIFIVIIPTIVFILGTILIDIFGHHDFQLDFSAESKAVGYVASGRYFFFAAFIFFVFIASSITSVFCRDICLFFDRKSQYRLLVCCVFIIIVIAIFIVLITRLDLAPRTYELLGNELFERAMQIASEGGPSWLPNSDNESRILFLYHILIRTGNIFTALGVASVVVGTISCLAIDDCRSASEFVHLFQVDRVRKYLYMSSIILMSGVVFIMSWLYWPSFMFEFKSAARAEFINLANGISAYYGVIYTLVLLAYYLPVTMILSGRANELVENRVIKSNADISADTVLQWRNELGATVSFANAYKSTFAILSPFLTGSFGFVVSLLTGPS